MQQTADRDDAQGQDHALRMALVNEVHARPFLGLSPPERATHLAMTSGEGGAAADRAHLVALCERHGAPHPPAGANHHVVDLGGLVLKWERHGEFCAWTFLRAGGFDAPFADMPLDAVPADWLHAIPGQRLVAAHLAVLGRAAPPPDAETLARWLQADFLAGSVVAGGAASVWTDFRVHADGFGRIVVHDRGLAPRQGGRMVQRLLEIETYRMMALLALPLAREIAPRIGRADQELLRVMDAMTAASGIAEQRRLLDRLTELSSGIERDTAASDYRFGAARAYGELVDQRIAELREQRIEGLQTYREFMDRRFVPALRTCRTAEARLAQMSRRLTRAGALLRTRVEIAVEAQNQEVLASMDRRAQMQLRLQETVEGLSVAAITYYLVGLSGYALNALGAAGLHLDKDVATGVAIPVSALLVWFGLRYLRRRLARAPGAAAAPHGRD
ncbi:MAG: DUF3422 family protein [Rhodospirillales bacterium]